MNKTRRERILDMIVRRGEGHIPSSFSIVDIVAYLYGDVLRHDPKDPSFEGRDRFILSKGHGCAALYVVLEEHGYLEPQDLIDYATHGGILGGHPDRTRVPGAEASTGSLGHGLPMAVGVAIGLRIRGRNERVFVLVGDAECNEGTVWESALVAAARKLGNLVLIVDNNRSAEVVLPIPDFVAKFRAFGWRTSEIDGHDKAAMDGVFERLETSPEGAPTVIVANTVKGKGISFMERDFGKWHHRVPEGEELVAAYAEIRAVPDRV